LTGVGTRYISGIATLNDRLIVILNLGALLDSAEPILAA
jgi:chemotaxis signal transduction protein